MDWMWFIGVALIIGFFSGLLRFVLYGLIGLARIPLFVMRFAVGGFAWGIRRVWR
jgi:hypothetical protein